VGAMFDTGGLPVDFLLFNLFTLTFFRCQDIIAIHPNPPVFYHLTIALIFPKKTAGRQIFTLCRHKTLLTVQVEIELF